MPKKYTKNLLGEFLRGTGTATRSSGSGVAVGVHQDGTQYVRAYSFHSSESDTMGCLTKSAHNTWVNASMDSSSVDSISFYTSRSSDTSALYCIKY